MLNDYKCEKCKKTNEYLDHRVPEKCKCGGKLKKVFPKSGSFKISGWNAKNSYGLRAK